MTSTPSLPLSKNVYCCSADRVAIVTFDLPIWLKATDIIKQANIPVTARLGGFHLLKSYLGSMGNIMQDSGLLKVIQLIYPGSTTANHIMDGGCFDKAIRAHLLIDAAIYQHIMKLAFTEERGDMRTFMEKVADGKTGARHTDQVVAVFEQRFEETFKRLAEGERTPALWVQYHHMVDVIKVFIRTERLADHNGHRSCIVTKMLHISLPLQPSSIRQGRTAVLSTHEGTRNFACLQGHLRKNVSLPTGTTLSVTPAMSGPALGVTSALSRH